MKQKAGFTIVELLIVIVVIGILAAITIVAYNGVQERSKTVRVQSDLRNLVQGINAARTNTGKTLMQITGSGNSRGSKAAADNVIDKVSAASGINLSGLKNGDPWGNFYRIDENENEVSTADCRPDVISVDGRSDLTVNVPLSQPTCI